MTANKALAIIMILMVICAVFLTYHRMMIRHDIEIIDDTGEIEPESADL